MRVVTDLSLPGRLPAPVETACYFAVSELLTNAVKHSGAGQARISAEHASGLLRDGLARLLQAHGLDVVAAVASAPELVDALVEHRPDVAIVDVRLPPGFSDAEVVGKLLGRHAREEPVTRLSAREREVPGLLAEGRSSLAIAQRLYVSEKGVGKHAANIFAKLGLAPPDDDNRRVLAVLAYLNS